MEMGVFVKDCPCLAKELKTIFDFYWSASLAKDKEQFEDLMANTPSLSFNIKRPLRMKYKNVDTDIYIAVSQFMIKSYISLNHL